MEGSIENLNKTAINNGVIIGIISFVITLLTYYMAPALLGSPMFGIGIMVVSLVIYIFFTIDLRKKVGGYWSFKEALKGIFLMAFIAGLIGLFANTVFYKFIEPNAFEKISGFVSDGLTETFEKLGMDQDQIDKEIEKMQKTLKSQYNPSAGDLLKTFGIAIITEFVMSLIFAAIFKKERPMFIPAAEEE